MAHWLRTTYDEQYFGTAFLNQRVATWQWVVEQFQTGRGHDYYRAFLLKVG